MNSNIEKLFEYQKKEAEKIKLIKSTKSVDDQQKYEKLVAQVKDAQAHSNKLETTAMEMLEDYKKIQKSYDDTCKSLDKLNSADLDKSSKEEVSNMTEMNKTLSNNFAILEKRTTAMAEKISSMISEFENAKKKYFYAREMHKQFKEVLEQKEKTVAPQIEKIDKELKELEKTIEKDLMDKYRQKRQDKIFPILVKLSGSSCGGCFTELPMIKLNTLKTKHYLECEHCRRIIFID